jgi:hypothetical protein
LAALAFSRDASVAPQGCGDSFGLPVEESGFGRLCVFVS